jgi:hypothetical protein
VLLWAEQGLGDTLQFIRYAADVKERGGRVIVTCPQALTSLVATCPGTDQVIAQGSPVPDYDYHVPLMSLPRIFGTSLETIPNQVPYLFTEPAKEARWRGELGSVSGVKVGIAWQGNPDHKKDRQRSFPLGRFEALARVDGIHLFSLQKGFGAGQLDELTNRFPILGLGPRLDTFADTAAVVRNLDLVITPDTAVAHLAGALGVPVWVPLPFASDWRWLLKREDSPWYPTMRLYRQERWGDWDRVFERIECDLKARALQCGRV